jgi:hypothetical protein
MIDIPRIVLLVFMLIFIVIVGTIGYPVEKMTMGMGPIEDDLEDGKCWCCSCGWQSCKTCAANAGKCCPQAMGFERWSFGKGAVGAPIVDINKKVADGTVNVDNGGVAKGDIVNGPGTYEQRQALLAALEKAGFQPHSLKPEDLNALLAKAVREDDFGGELMGDCK